MVDRKVFFLFGLHIVCVWICPKMSVLRMSWSV